MDETRQRIQLVRLLYVSRAVGPQTTAVTDSILSVAQSANRQRGITGVLCQGQGLYLQVLEGERGVINALYNRITQDRRHQDVQLLLLEEISQRRYADWAMAHVLLADDDPMVQLHHPEFDPYSAPGASVLKMVADLVAKGQRIRKTSV
ncbi:BLUF domain-containing protein [Rhodoferax sp. BLA1]|uniref:BLUF domain-containing protein n=1 Tax=Rhodoferax sp. BLA1 TaxID=2576062 RepID=UPI0015D148BE|nr:BLUF domain-containing protein [Rhodoferax sp. BLA1]